LGNLSHERKGNGGIFSLLDTGHMDGKTAFSTRPKDGRLVIIWFNTKHFQYHCWNANIERNVNLEIGREEHFLNIMFSY